MCNGEVALIYIYFLFGKESEGIIIILIQILIPLFAVFIVVILFLLLLSLLLFLLFLLFSVNVFYCGVAIVSRDVKLIISVVVRLDQVPVIVAVVVAVL